MPTSGINPEEIRRLLSSSNGPVARDLLRRGQAVQNRAKQILRREHRIDTGRLVNSITVQLIERGGFPIAVIGTPVSYAPFIHNGTGIYGPHRTPIRPVHAQFLRFKPKGAREFVFAREVRGTHATPFLRDALPAAHGGR